MSMLRNSMAIAACGALAMGCGRGADENAPKPTPPPAAAEPSPASPPAQVSLSGCLEAGAAGAGTYVLRNVRFDPPGGSDPHRNTTSGQDGITEGSWVRLVAAENLQPQIGRRVAVTGIVTDQGANTIGTAGSSGTVLPSGDRSQAASTEHYSTKVKKESGRIGRESMANGTAAEIRAAQMKDLGEACQDAGIRR
jgi:hypothetical protein